MMTHPSDDTTIVRDSSALPVARNTVLLSAALASHSAMLSLTAAVASITLVRVLDLEWLLGLGPAVVLTAGALAAVPAGRGMDRLGRVPVLLAGFGVGAAGCGLAALGSARGSALAVLADRTKPWERGSLLGFNDLLSSATGAGLTLLGGLVLTAAGVASLTIGAVALLVAPALWILLASDSSRRSS
jgi:MFS family permease